jgi:hypothetical protein
MQTVEQAQSLDAGTNLHAYLQSLVDFNVQQVLDANTLEIDGPGLQNWTTLVNSFWQYLQEVEQ